MKEIVLSPTRNAYFIFILGLPLYLSLLFFSLKYDYLDRSISIVSVVWVSFLSFTLLIALYFLIKKNHLIMDERGIRHFGQRSASLAWEEIEEVKNHFILPQDFITIKLKEQGANKQKAVHLYVRHFAANADVLVNFIRDMAKSPVDQRKSMMHNLDWLGVKSVSVEQP